MGRLHLPPDCDGDGVTCDRPAMVEAFSTLVQRLSRRRDTTPSPPPSPSVYSGRDSLPPPPDGLAGSSPGPSSSRARVQVQYSGPANFSRPTPPRTPEGERAKRDVLLRIRGQRSIEDDLARSRSRSRTGPQLRFATPSPSRPDATAGRSTDPQRSRLSPSPSFPQYDLPLERPALVPYDRYSWYELPSPNEPSPGDQFLKPKAPSVQPWNPDPSTSAGTSPRRIPARTSSPSAEEYLTKGIDAHLRDDPDALVESAHYFEQSATHSGGCAFGMLMWGLCLRHGWGVDKDERKAFAWLRKACLLAVGDLEQIDGVGLDKLAQDALRPKGSRQQVKAELILAIYEVGQSFFQGWGVPKDRAMGFKYFLVAARLGDVDAQQELAYCYLNGKGCKKDRKEAAKWYRAAADQSASTVGLAWIYKEKFVS